MPHVIHDFTYDGTFEGLLSVYIKCIAMKVRPLDIRPDFERQVIEGLLKGYGKIRLWSFARIAVKVIFNKNLMMVVKRVKTIVEA